MSILLAREHSNEILPAIRISGRLGEEHVRRFHSYGPVDCQQHSCVTREALVGEHCVSQLIGLPEEVGSPELPRAFRGLLKAISSRLAGRDDLGSL